MNFCQHRIEICHDCADAADAELTRLRAQLARVEEEAKRLREAVEWAMGTYTNQFQCQSYRMGASDRAELRRRATGG